MSNAGVLFLAERRDQGLAKMTAELVTAGRTIAEQLGEELVAVLVGVDLAGSARELVGLGVPKVYVIDDPMFARYGAEPYVALMTQLCAEVRPRVVLMGHTDVGRDLAPRLAFKLGTGMVPNCVHIDVDAASGELQMTRPVFGGKAHGLYTLADASQPQIVTVGQKVFDPAVADAGHAGAVLSFTPAIDAAAIRTAVVERVEDATEGIKLEDASVIVSGGRGVGSAEGFAQLKELATVLGGCLGASRAPVDSGLVPSNLQVGLTGTVVSPSVYIAVGISGAAQHMAGCSSARTIIAVNRDPEAPIFQRAHFGAVADWKEIVPSLTQKCRALLG